MTANCKQPDTHDKQYLPRAGRAAETRPVEKRYETPAQQDARALSAQIDTFVKAPDGARVKQDGGTYPGEWRKAGSKWLHQTMSDRGAPLWATASTLAQDARAQGALLTLQAADSVRPAGATVPRWATTLSHLYREARATSEASDALDKENQRRVDRGDVPDIDRWKDQHAHVEEVKAWVDAQDWSRFEGSKPLVVWPTHPTRFASKAPTLPPTTSHDADVIVHEYGPYSHSFWRLQRERETL